MAGVYSGADLFPSLNLPTTTLTVGDLQQPVQFPQSGLIPHDIGTVFLWNATVLDLLSFRFLRPPIRE